MEGQTLHKCRPTGYMSMRLTKLRTFLIRQLSLVLAVSALLTMSVVPVVQAISPEQLKIFNDSIPYFNFRDNECSGQQAVAANLTVGKDFNLGQGAQERVVNLMKALIADYQFTPEQAAGILGNFMRESGGEDVPPDINEGGAKGPPRFSGGYGWAQWTGPRQVQFIDFAVQNGYMASRGVNATDAANYAWLKEELATGYKRTVDALKATSTSAEATTSFMNTFERPGVPASAERQAAAAQALEWFNGGGGGGATGTGSGAGGNCGGATGAVGDTVFPLKTTKSGVLNRNIFSGGTTNKAGHPYTAYDILANPGTEVIAFMSGTVTLVTEDKCPGRMLSIYNQESDMVISYLHMNMDPSTHIANGTVVKPGDHVGVVGPPDAGCKTPHLHIDAAKGKTRPGCAREGCPAANAAKFIDIGPQLFETYQALPD